MFLGIDIGTSGIKSTIVDLMGSIKAHVYYPLTTYGMKEKKRELDPLEVGEKVLEAVEAVLNQAKTSDITLITIASLGEAIVPISADGRVLMNSIVGSDSRGGEELEWLIHQLDEKVLTDITGLNLSYIYSLNKILYIKRHYPEIHDQVWKYMCFTDYTGYLLTGEAKIDYAMASRTMAFDIHKKEWSKQILDAAGIDAEYFSRPVQGGEIIGKLSNNLSRRLGLGNNIPVMAGSHDHIFNALGAGAVFPGICSNIVGTTEGITTVLKKPMSSDSISRNNISCQPFVRPNIFNTVAWHNTAGAMVNWYIDIFFRNSENKKNELLQSLNKTLDTMPSPIMILPHFAGATARYMDEKAKGGIIGLSLNTTKEEIYKGILEGSAYECRVIIDCILEAGIPIEKIIISGGGSNSLLWLKIKANILGMPVYKSAFSDTGAVGGAILGAVVTGVYGSLKEAYEQMIPQGEKIEPDMKYHEIYEERFLEYKELYTKLKSINHKLS